MRRVVWFSCGAASAVAAKLIVDRHTSSCEVVYCDTLISEHPDNKRFLKEVEVWIGRKITIIKSDKFGSVDDVFEKTRYISGIKGARCTVEMKKIPREKWQKPNDIHVFGYTFDEVKRADTFEKNNPALDVEWILIDEKIDKHRCLAILSEAGIKLPEMYSLGFDHNNCLGCVKATSPKYWNKVRMNFPSVFKNRCVQSRLLGVKLVRFKGERIFLDELPVDATGPKEDIECGPVCQTIIEEPA